MKKVLSIAGSDSSGGAGMQADLKTMICNGVFGMSVLTAVTAQNTVGVADVFDLPCSSVSAQIDAVFTDIVPDAVKIGMVSNKELIATIAERLDFYQAPNIVVDPVMIATSQGRLLQEDAVSSFIEKLMPLATVITPNLFEASILSGLDIVTHRDMEKAATVIAKKTQAAILIKGGHLEESADDLLYQNGTCLWLKAPLIDNPNTHGTGCTLSSAIASALAQGEPLEVAVQKGKEYVSGCINAQLNLGKGRGPLNHAYRNIVSAEK